MGNSKNILIVDDSQLVRAELRAALEREGHVVAEAADGMAALKVVNSQENLDLIISDQNMPLLDGLSLCQEVRKVDKFGGVPFVMMTTESSDRLKALGKQVGVHAWVVKPMDYVVLAKNIDLLVKSWKSKTA